MRVLSLFFLVALVALSGCLTTHPRLQPEAAPAFVPEAFFEGETRGLGTLTIRGRGARLVRVRSRGERLPDGSFRLDQTITIGDNSPTTRTWTLRRTPSGYTSELTDADGPVTVEVRGAELRIRYGLPGPLVVDQRLYLQPGGQTALNLTTVRLLGVPVARLNEQIEREGRPMPQ